MILAIGFINAKKEKKAIVVSSNNNIDLAI